MVEVTFGAAIDTSHQGVSSDVELALVDKQWVVDVLLHNTSAAFATRSFFDQSCDFSDVFCDWDALPSVGVLSRLDDPDILLVAMAVLVIILKPLELRILESILHVESHRQSYKGILAHGLVVGAHIDEQSFFIW